MDFYINYFDVFFLKELNAMISNKNIVNTIARRYDGCEFIVLLQRSSWGSVKPRPRLPFTPSTPFVGCKRVRVNDPCPMFAVRFWRRKHELAVYFSEDHFSIDRAMSDNSIAVSISLNHLEVACLFLQYVFVLVPTIGSIYRLSKSFIF